MKILQPENWGKPSGYSNGVAAEGTAIFVAGQVGWNENNEIVSPVFAEQARQALENIVAVLAAGDAKPEHIVRMTWYVADINEYKSSLREVGLAYRDVIGDHYPAMSLFQVAALLEDGAKVEIEATAVIPNAK